MRWSNSWYVGQSLAVLNCSRNRPGNSLSRYPCILPFISSLCYQSPYPAIAQGTSSVLCCICIQGEKISLFKTEISFYLRGSPKHDGWALKATTPRCDGESKGLPTRAENETQTPAIGKALAGYDDSGSFWWPMPPLDLHPLSLSHSGHLPPPKPPLPPTPSAWRPSWPPTPSNPHRGLQLRNIIFHGLSSCRSLPHGICSHGLWSHGVSSRGLLPHGLSSHSLRHHGPKYRGIVTIPIPLNLQKSFGPRSHVGPHTRPPSTLSQPPAHFWPPPLLSLNLSLVSHPCFASISLQPASLPRLISTSPSPSLSVSIPARPYSFSPSQRLSASPLALPFRSPPVSTSILAHPPLLLILTLLFSLPQRFALSPFSISLHFVLVLAESHGLPSPSTPTQCPAPSVASYTITSSAPCWGSHSCPASPASLTSRSRSASPAPKTLTLSLISPPHSLPLSASAGRRGFALTLGQHHHVPSSSSSSFCPPRAPGLGKPPAPRSPPLCPSAS